MRAANPLLPGLAAPIVPPARWSRLSQYPVTAAAVLLATYGSLSLALASDNDAYRRGLGGCGTDLASAADRSRPRTAAPFPGIPPDSGLATGKSAAG